MRDLYRKQGEIDNEDSFASFTEMKLDKIYRESSELFRQLENFDNKYQVARMSEGERKKKLKKLEGMSWEIYYLLKKKMKNDPNNFICSIG